MTAGPSPEAGMSRRDLLRLSALLAVLLLLTGIVVLATAGGSDGGGPVTTKTAEGLLTEVSEQRLVLAPSDGSAQMTFEVRAQDARSIDFFHLEQHSADQLLSVVTYEQDGNRRYAVRVDDAPVG